MSNSVQIPESLKRFAVSSIDKLISYITELGGFPTLTTSQKSVFCNILKELRDIRQRVTMATEHCITDSDMNILEQLADKLTNDAISQYFVSTTIQQRLGSFWLLCKEILRNADPLDIILWRDSQNQIKISSAQSVSRLERVRNTTSLITKAILDEPQRDILTISSILLSIVLRTEASEFELSKIINFAKNYVPVAGQKN